MHFAAHDLHQIQNHERELRDVGKENSKDDAIKSELGKYDFVHVIGRGVNVCICSYE